MVFNSHATNQDLVSDVTFWITGSATGTTDYGINDITRTINEYYNEVVSIILKSDGRWEWDDSNFTTLPIGTKDLVSGQGDYDIDSAELLNVIKVEVKDSSGKWIVLSPMSYDDKRGTAMSTLDDTQGTPTEYDKVGNSLILHTIPNYSSSGGLKVYFQRPPSYFSYDDTIKEPGFSPLFHRYLSMGAALDYCTVNTMTGRVNILTAKMNDMRTMITEHYSKRSRDERIRMSVKNEGYDSDDSYIVSANKIVW